MKLLETDRGYIMYCPGCKSHHRFDNRWTFNNDLEYPTFFPSMLVTVDRGKNNIKRCHFYLENGKIQYLEDSTHDLKGKIIDLPTIGDIPTNWNEMKY